MTADYKSLGQRSRAMIARASADGCLAISAISFWEFALLVAKRRFISDKTPVQMRRELLAAGVVEIPLNGDIAILSVELEELRGDPADRFIAATAVIHGATLMTADADLLRWRHAIQRQDASK